jgi:hypothetical protein
MKTGALGKITERWIRKCLPSEYKRGCEGDKDKRELSSLSNKKPIPVSGTGPTAKQEQDKEQADLAEKPQLKQEVVVHVSGQEAVAKPRHSPEENLTKTQEVGSGNGTRIDTDTSPPQPSDKHIGQECPSCRELEEKVIELSEALKHTSMQTADEIPGSESKIIILKETHQMMRDAMKKSKNAIFVICDGSKKFVRVVADVDN